MKKTAIVLAMIFIISISVGFAAWRVGIDEVVRESNEAKLLFEDNFDFLDLTKWKVNPIPENKRRAAYYHEDNVFAEDGNLILRMNYQESGEYGAGWYAGWVETSRFVKEYAKSGYNGFSTVNGFFEFRCRADWTKGAWSAIWLQPDNSSTFGINDVQDTGIDGAEIDIMETNGLKNFNTHVVHYDGYDSRLKSVKSSMIWVDNMTTEYHTYGLEWNETEYKFYIDGKLTFTTSSMGISTVDQYIILSNEVGGYNDETGMYPGINPDGSKFWFGNIDTTANRELCFDIAIDYVRVYDKKPV